MASVREIQDTSRQGRFHNTRYRALAEELGLAVAKADSIGWSATTVPDATAALYRAELRRLGGARRLPPRGAGGRGGRTNNNNGVAALCGCGRRVRVAASVLEEGPITCGLCGTDFEAAEPGG